MEEWEGARVQIFLFWCVSVCACMTLADLNCTNAYQFNGVCQSPSQIWTHSPLPRPQVPFSSMPQCMPHHLLSWQAFSTRWIPCPHANCSHLFKTAAGLKHHQSSLHNFSFTSSSATSGSWGWLTPAKPAPGIICDYHDKLTGMLTYIFWWSSKMNFQVVYVMQMAGQLGPIHSHHLYLKRDQMTGDHMTTSCNSRPLNLFSRMERCLQEISISYVTFGGGHSALLELPSGRCHSPLATGVALSHFSREPLPNTLPTALYWSQTLSTRSISSTSHRMLHSHTPSLTQINPVPTSKPSSSSKGQCATPGSANMPVNDYGGFHDEDESVEWDFAVQHQRTMLNSKV